MLVPISRIFCGVSPVSVVSAWALHDRLDDPVRLAHAVQHAGLEYSLHERHHEQLVALDSLQVRAEAEAVAQPPELQCPVAVDEMLARPTVFRWSYDVGAIAVGRQTSTPPSALMTLTNPVKFSSTKSSILMCVVCSIVFHRQPGPP